MRCRVGSRPGGGGARVVHGWHRAERGAGWDRVTSLGRAGGRADARDGRGKGARAFAGGVEGG